MKEQGISWFQFYIDQFQLFQGFVYSFHIGTHLLAGESVVYTIELMGTPDDLKATIFFIGWAQSCHHTDHIREQETILIPVSVILMPCLLYTSDAADDL